MESNYAIVQTWCEWADRIKATDLVYDPDFKTLAAALPEAVIEQLGTLYSEAVRDNHLAHLNRWIEANGLRVPMGRDERAIRNLLRVFSQLGRGRRYRPFSTHAMRSEHMCDAALDWSKLPDEMKFLAPAASLAERFTYSFSDPGRGNIQANTTAEERAIFLEAANGVRVIGYPAIRVWCNKMGLEHRETSLLFNLMAVLDALELPYFERKEETQH
jgi:hypothetical protein